MLSAGSPSTARRRSSSSLACSTAAAPSRRSASTSSTTTTSTPSSSCRRTSSSARRSRPASSCSRSRRRTTTSCSSTPRPSSCAPGNKNKLTEANQQKILDAFTAREDVDHFAKLVDEQRHRRQRLQHRGLLLRRGRGHPRGRRHHGAQRRDRADRRAPGTSCATQIDAIVADLESARVSRIDDLDRRTLPERSRVSSARRARRLFEQRQRPKADFVERRAVRSTTARSTRTTERRRQTTISFVTPRPRESYASVDPGDVVITTTQRERRGRRQGRRVARREVDRH